MRFAWMQKILPLLLLASPASAVTTTAFTHAQTLNAGEIELNLSAMFGDRVWNAGLIGRFGIIEDLQLDVAAHFVNFEDRSDEGHTGFEFAVAPRFSFIRVQETGFVDCAIGATGSILSDGDLVVLGADPAFYMSRHFDIGDNRSIYVAGTAGVALTWWDTNDGHTSWGVLLGAGAGVSLNENLRLETEFRWRDDTWRLGVGVTYAL